MKPWFILFALATLAAAAPATAQQRTYSIGSFDRVRIAGPFKVIVTLGISPHAVAEGSTDATDAIDVRVEGTTLIVSNRLSNWGERPVAGDARAPVIRVSTLAIRGVVATGAAQVQVGGAFRGQRLDLSLTGSGTLDAPTIQADQLFATVLGSGRMTLGGHAAKARLTTSGTASIAAARLDSGDLTVRLDGNGEIAASARFTAGVTATGLGAVTVYGKPACTVAPGAGGPVSCGKLPAP